MRSRTDQAYVLRTYPVGEADVIVTLLAERSGRVRGVAPGARRSRRRFGGALEPLTRVAARWNEREGRELQRLESLEPVRSHVRLQSDPGMQAACAILAEIAEATSREGEADARTFRLLGACLGALEDGVKPWGVVRYYEYWTLRLHGVLPELNACEACGRKLASKAPRRVVLGAGIRCRSCSPGIRGESRKLGPSELAFLAAAATRPPGTITEAGRAARPGGALEALLRGVLEEFVERSFRTYRHLERLEPVGTAKHHG